MNKQEIIRFIYDIIKCNGKNLDCIGKDCHLCISEKIAYYIKYK
ncbi:hypothetical protein [Romboutsia sp. 1001713B170207_170306_H8]|nr:hypothetical protein [Romboutsia sp. 1001713B170207_170306_H8]